MGKWLFGFNRRRKEIILQMIKWIPKKGDRVRAELSQNGLGPRWQNGLDAGASGKWEDGRVISADAIDSKRPFCGFCGSSDSFHRFFSMELGLVGVWDSCTGLIGSRYPGSPVPTNQDPEPSMPMGENTACSCDIVSLMTRGCPSAKGGACINGV